MTVLWLRKIHSCLVTVLYTNLKRPATSLEKSALHVHVLILMKFSMASLIKPFSLSLSPILYTTTECISMTSYFLGALVTALGMLDDIHGLNCVPLSAKTSNHRFRKCHRTFKIARLTPKTCLLVAFRRQKCRLGVEIVSKLVGITAGITAGIKS